MEKANYRNGRRIQWLVFGLTIALLILAAPIRMAADFKGRMSHHWSPKHHSAIMSEKFAREVAKATNGRLVIEVFPQGQLYSIAQVVPALAQGSVDLGGVLGMMLMQADRNFYLMAMPYFFESYDQMRAFWETDPVGNRYWKAVQQKLGIKILGYVPVGPSCYFTNVRPLDSVAAFQGLKARTLVPTERFGFQPLGVSYVSVSTAEVYNALKTGMINTLSTVPSVIKGSSWWDFLKYAQKPYNIYADAFIVVNLKWWNGLPADIRQIVENDVAPQISKEATAEVTGFSEAVLREFVSERQGTISTLSQTEYRKLMELHHKVVYPQFAKHVDPELYQAALKFVGQQ